MKQTKRLHFSIIREGVKERGREREKGMIFQGGRLFEGGYYFKYFHQRGGGRLFEGGGGAINQGKAVTLL